MSSILSFSARSWKYLLLGLFFICFLACSESKQEMLVRLAQTIAENKEKSEQIELARKEITERVIKENRRYSIQLAEADPGRLVRVSFDGSTLLWFQEDQLYYLRGEKRWKLDLDLEGRLVDMNPSWSAKYLVLFDYDEKEKKCRPTVLSLAKKKILDYGLPKLECGNTPVVNDSGDTLFYAAKGELRRFPLDTLSSKAKLSKGISFSAKHFVKKYKKIKNRFILYQVGPQALLLLFGNLGYYNMYYYNAQEEDKLAKSNIVFSSSRIFPSFRKAKDRDSSIEIQTQEKKRLRLYKAHAFGYSGGAGKRRLHALHFGKDLEVGQGFKTEVFSQLIFLEGQGQFLSVQEQKLYFWDPVGAQMQRLPLAAKNLFLFRNGLIYVDLLGQLYLRERLFSDFEMSLLDLYHEISSRELSLNGTL